VNDFAKDFSRPVILPPLHQTGGLDDLRRTTGGGIGSDEAMLRHTRQQDSFRARRLQLLSNFDRWNNRSAALVYYLGKAGI
jgi:hypothetical protein